MLGNEHPKTLEFIKNLALVYANVGNFPKRPLSRSH